MLFTSLITLALAAVSLAAPAPTPDVELENRANGFESISIGLTVVITAYRTNPSFDNRLNLCRFTNRFNDNQRSSARRFGFDPSGIQCPTIYDQLSNIQPGLGTIYQQWTRNRNDPTVIAALCRITTRLTQGQSTRISQLGVTINVQCVVDIRQQLEGISNGLSTAYFNWRGDQNNFGYQQALCTITTRLNARQTATLQSLNLNINVQCTAVLLRGRLNNILLGFGNAWYNWTISGTDANLATLCGLTAQLTNRQKTRLLNLGVDVSTFNCPA